MSKRIYKTATENTRKKIKSGAVEKSQLKGAALSYYNRVQGAAKARAAKEEKVFKVGDAVVPRNSELYRIVETAAAAKGVTVKQFTTENQKSIKRLLQEGDVVVNREAGYAIKDITHIGKGKMVYVNDLDGYVRKGRNATIFGIQQLQQYCFSNSDIFLIFFLLRYKLNGDIYLYLPGLEQYDGLEGEELEEFLDDYYPHITYLKSAKTQVENVNKPNKRKKRP